MTHTVSRWKVPLAVSLLAFAMVWRLAEWVPQNHGQDVQDWVEENQVTLNVSLPANQEDTLLMQPETIAQSVDRYEWQTFTIKAGANLGLYFQQAGLDSKELQDVMAIKRDAHFLKRIYPDQKLRLQTTEEGKLYALQLDVDPLTTLVIQRQDNGQLKSTVEAKPIEKRIAFGGKRIVDSFFVAGKSAQLDDGLIMDLASVFAYDIDFAQDIQPNDYFKVLFEEYFVNGVKVGNGPIVAAEFVNNGQKYRAIRYTDASGQASYYSPQGQSLKKAFIRTPVQFTRISSHFNLKRRHPILHHVRAHKGVDYAAPQGTPVKAVGNGKVAFVGKKGGYGNVIILQHGNKYSTLYGHLSQFAKKMRAGSTIKQGQIIGYVGATGLATAPHLHYEFRIDGIHHNPLTVALPNAEGVAGPAKAPFLARSKELLRLMDHHAKVLVAANEF